MRHMSSGGHRDWSARSLSGTISTAFNAGRPTAEGYLRMPELYRGIFDVSGAIAPPIEPTLARDCKGIYTD